MRPIILACLAATLAPFYAAAQSRHTPHTLTLDDVSTRPPASIADVAWMAGHWRAPAFGGIGEEIWTPPYEDSMMGMYKTVRDGVTTMYEFFTLTEEEGSLVIKLKHFGPDMKGWEAVDEYVSFPLVRIEDQAAYFDGITYIRVGENRLRTYLALSRGGEVEEVHFDYELIRTAH